MNSKDDMIQGLDNLLENKTQKTEKTASTEPSKQEQERRSRTGRPQNGDNRKRLTKEYAYTSLAIDKDLYAKLRKIAFDNGLPYKDLLDAAIRKYIELYEAKHGPVQTSSELKISADSLI